jgi:hypothetical protein
VAICPAPGTVIQRRNVATQQRIVPLQYVAAPPGSACVASNGAATTWRDLFGMRDIAAPHADRLGAAMAQLFPLEVGKRATALVTDTTGTLASGGQWLFEFEVLRREQVTVPAGTFDAWVVRLTERGMSGNSFLGERAVWLDAATLRPLRTAVRLHQGRYSQPPIEWEATGFSATRL